MLCQQTLLLLKIAFATNCHLSIPWNSLSLSLASIKFPALSLRFSLWYFRAKSLIISISQIRRIFYIKFVARTSATKILSLEKFPVLGNISKFVMNYFFSSTFQIARSHLASHSKLLLPVKLKLAGRIRIKFLYHLLIMKIATINLIFILGRVWKKTKRCT